MESERTLTELLSDLEEAGVKLEEARKDESKARNRSTDALNVYNGITKRIDAATRKIRESAPAGTDWTEKSVSGVRK